jgi:hypothetical protein
MERHRRQAHVTLRIPARVGIGTLTSRASALRARLLLDLPRGDLVGQVVVRESIKLPERPADPVR